MESIGFIWWADIDRAHTPPGAAIAQDELALYAHACGPVRVNCHIRVPGRFNHRYALLFRDYLRTHPGPAAAYGEITQQLARHFPHDAVAYYDIKDPVCDVIMAGAEA